MGTESIEDRSGAEYLAQLLKDKKQIQAFPNVFIHLERLLDDEINKVRITLFNLEKKPIQLPDEDGPKVTLQEKLFVPVKEHPDFNFVGRILGPRGITAKQLERDTGCKIMVRGKGSMRDKKKEEQMKGKPNWEHLSEELHVLVVVEDTQRRTEVKMQRAVDEIKRLLVPAPEGEDDLKKIQLMELAIMNGTYKDQTRFLQAAQQSQLQTRLMGQPIIPNATMPALNLALQSPFYRPQAPSANSQLSAVASPYALLSQRLGSVGTSVGSFQPGLASASDAAQAQAQLYSQALQGANANLATTQQDYSHYQQLMSPTTLVDYQQAMDQSAAGAMPKVRRAMTAAPHPYHRA